MPTDLLTVTRRDLLLAPLKLQEEFNKLIRNVRQEDDPIEKNKIVQDIEINHKTNLLIEFALDYCKDNKPYCLYTIVVEWLLDVLSKNSDPVNEEILCRQINEVMDTFLNEEEKSAVNYYSSQPKLNAYPLIKVNYLLYFSTKLLSLQSPPAGILPLFSAFFDEPHQFAAMLIWAINQKISPRELLKSSLLYDFIQYHLHEIGQEDNVVAQVFSLLSKFKDDKEIQQFLLAVSTTSCGLRGFEKYSLTGHVGDELITQNTGVPSLDLSVTEGNIANLYYCFGTVFLEQAINLLSKKHSSELRNVLKKLLEESEGSLEHLSKLMNEFSRLDDSVKKESLFKAVSEVVGDEAAKYLLTKTTAAIYLIQYKPALFPEITEENLKQFINRIVGSSDVSFDKIAQLMALLKFLRKKESPLAHLLFIEMMELVLANVKLVQDDYNFISEVRKYLDTDSEKNGMKFLGEVYEKYENNLSDFIASYTMQTLTTKTYKIIEDYWYEKFIRLEFLDNSLYCYGAYPRETGELKVYILIAFIKQQDDTFNLSSAIDILTADHEDIEERNEEKLQIYITLLRANNDDCMVYNFVDTEFIEQAIMLLSKRPDAEWDCPLQGLFNESEQALEKLAELMDHFARLEIAEEKEPFFKAVATVVGISAVRALSEKTSSVIYLIQYYPLTYFNIYDTDLRKILKHAVIPFDPGFMLNLDKTLIRAIVKRADQLALLLKQLPEARLDDFLLKLGKASLDTIVRGGPKLARFLEKLPKEKRFYFVRYLLKVHDIRSRINCFDHLNLILKQLVGIEDNDFIFRAFSSLYMDGIISDYSNLAAFLKWLPETYWRKFISLNTSIIKNVINKERVIIYQEDLQLIDGLEEDEVTELDENLMQLIAKDGTAVAMRTLCKTMPNALLIDCCKQKENVRSIIKNRHLEDPVTYDLSLDEFDALLRQQLCFSQALDYLVDKHEQCHENKITQAYFNTRMRDFCSIINVFSKFFAEYGDAELSTKAEALKEHVHSYIESDEGKIAFDRIKSSGEANFSSSVFPVSADPYNRYRDGLLKIDLATLTIRYGEFKSKIWNAKAMPSSMKAVVDIVLDAFDYGDGEQRCRLYFPDGVQYTRMGSSTDQEWYTPSRIGRRSNECWFSSEQVEAEKQHFLIQRNFCPAKTFNWDLTDEELDKMGLSDSPELRQRFSSFS